MAHDGLAVRRKMVRRWIILATMVAVLSGALTGCGSSSKDELPRIKEVPTGRFRKKPTD
jgi:hypothetical protein